MKKVMLVVVLIVFGSLKSMDRNLPLNYERALIEVENINKIVFKSLDFKQNISEQKSDLLENLFLRLKGLFDASNNSDLKTQFNKIHILYLNTLKLIQDLAKHGAAKSEKLFLGRSLKETLDLKMTDFKAINENVKKIKITNPVEKNALQILRILLNLYEPIIKKIKIDFVPTKQEVMGEIDTASKVVFNKRLSLGIKKDAIALLEKVFDKIRLFVDFNSQDLPKLFDRYKGFLDSSIYQMNDLANSRFKMSELNNAERVVRLNNVYKSIDSQINNAAKLVNTVTTVFEGPRSAKQVMLYFVEKYKNGFNKFKIDMEKYFEDELLKHYKTFDIDEKEDEEVPLKRKESKKSELKRLEEELGIEYLPNEE